MPTLGSKEDILSLGVHFTADKKRRPPAHSCKGTCNEGIITLLKLLIHYPSDDDDGDDDDDDDDDVELHVLGCRLTY